MRLRTPLAARLAFSVAAVAFIVPGALAQTAPETVPTSDEGDRIVITGVGPARTSDEMIASTTVLSDEAITERMSGGLGDTLQGLPGVSTTAFGPGASRPVIRGLGAERVQVLTNGIGVIDASAASPDHAVTGDPLGAERIEILRGPATLAYGGGATGGVVNVIDGLIVEKLPDETLSALGYAGYTSADEGTTLSARATGNSGPLVGVLSWTRRESGDLDIPGFAEGDIILDVPSRISYLLNTENGNVLPQRPPPSRRSQGLRVRRGSRLDAGPRLPALRRHRPVQRHEGQEHAHRRLQVLRLPQALHREDRDHL